MKKLKFKLKNIKEENLIWNKFKSCIYFTILISCLIVVLNLNINTNESEENLYSEKSIMKYVFHDYDGNVYVLNDETHGTSVSLDYLINDDVPDVLKDNNETEVWSVSIWDVIASQWDGSWNEILKNNDVKNNQISVDEIIQELWVDENLDDLEIDFDEVVDDWNNQDLYTVTQEESWNIMVITKQDGNSSMNSDENVGVNSGDLDYLGQVFTFVVEWYVQPILIPWDQLSFNENWKSITCVDNIGKCWYETNSSWVTIIGEYADCMTPRWYKIVHWDSVLAYQQMKNAPDICNIERRFCWKWKLSWTYTQQWCSINTNYTYEKWWEIEVSTEQDDTNPDVIQNPDWSVKVNDKEIWSSFVFERPSQTSTPGYYQTDNIVVDEEVDQTKKPHWDCTAPRWEKVKHWQIVQAFKHANWFSDAPCEAQIRICSMGYLKWSYTESTCKTRDTSFIDWINGSPTWETYSREKLEWVRRLIREEQSYDRNFRRITNSDELDRILSILDE